MPLHKTSVGCEFLCDDVADQPNSKKKSGQSCECVRYQTWQQSSLAIPQEDALVSGQPTTREQAQKQIAKLIASSSEILITGLAACHTRSVRQAVKLAEHLGCTIDPVTAAAKRFRLQAMVQNGGATCTLGEVKNRADLILVWDVDAIENKDCFLKHLALEQPTPFIPQGRAGRKIISISRNNATKPSWSDQHLVVGELQSTDVLNQMTRFIQNAAQDDHSKKSTQTSSPWEIIAAELLQAQYPVLFTNDALANGEDETAWFALSRLIRELNFKNRIHTLAVPSSLSAATAESVLSWQTGFSSSINFSAGYPQHDLDRWSTAQQLHSENVELCIVVGEINDTLQKLLIESTSKVIVLGAYSERTKALETAVTYWTQRDGFHNAGTFLRFDHVPIPAREISPSDLPKLEDALKLCY